jgi:uncharacterized protein (TIGR02246 family)
VFPVAEYLAAKQPVLDPATLPVIVAVQVQERVRGNDRAFAVASLTQLFGPEGIPDGIPTLEDDRICHASNSRFRAVENSQATVRRWLDAVQDRDIDEVLDCFSPNGSWQNVPHPPAIGQDAIRAMLEPILARSEQVMWDIVTESYGSDRAWLERVDRFVIDGTEYAVRCNGVLEIDPGLGLITAVRDYVDLGEWRSRITAANL